MSARSVSSSQGKCLIILDKPVGGLGPEQVQVWHDEAARLEQTGRLDQGPCWCADCIGKELDNVKG